MEKSLKDMQKVVFSQRKTLAKIYQKFGSLSLAKYVSLWPIQKEVVDKKVLKIIFELTKKLYGQKLANLMVKQIEKTGLVSTIDHLGIWGHPFFLNSNLIFSLYPKLKFLPVLATSGVSLNNSSWPTAFSFFSKQTEKLEKFAFFSDSQKMQTVFASKAIGKAELSKVLLNIANAIFLTAEEKEVLKNLIEELFKNSKVLNFKSFSDQACLISQKFWEKVFPKKPKLVYLSLEKMVSEVMQKIVLKDQKNILNKVFFQHTEKLSQTFWGMKGCFGENAGTFLFWGLDEKGRRMSLKLVNGNLVSGNFILKYEAKNIALALKQKQIYPSSLACFLVLLSSGLNCIGGFNQTSWLTDIKEKFTELLNSIGELKYSKFVSQVPTENFAESILVTEKYAKKVFTPSALNIYLSMNLSSYLNMNFLAKTTTVAKSIESQLPEMYKILR